MATELPQCLPNATHHCPAVFSSPHSDVLLARNNEARAQTSHLCSIMQQNRRKKDRKTQCDYFLLCSLLGHRVFHNCNHQTLRLLYSFYPSLSLVFVRGALFAPFTKMFAKKRKYSIRYVSQQEELLWYWKTPFSYYMMQEKSSIFQMHCYN